MADERSAPPAGGAGDGPRNRGGDEAVHAAGGGDGPRNRGGGEAARGAGGGDGSEARAPSASERAYRHVKERVLDGRLPGGELITEGEVAEALGISRTPVRGAFTQLESE